MIGAGKQTKQGLARSAQIGRMDGTLPTISAGQSKYYEHSLFVTGISSGDYVDLRYINRRMFPVSGGASQYGQGTIEFWFMVSANSTVEYSYLLDQPELSYWPNKTRILFRSSATNQIQVNTQFGSTTVSSGLLALRTIGLWNHIALTFENNTSMTVWLNGNRSAILSDGAGGVLGTSASSYFRIGSNGVPPTYFQDFRVSTNIRYNNANTTYTEPIGPFENDEYTYCLFRFNENDSSTTKTYGLLGNTAVTTAQSKFGSSFSFDGSSDYIYALNDSQTKFVYGSSSDFTIEMFFYLNEQGAYNQYLYDQRNVGTAVAPAIYTNNGVLYYYAGTANRITSTAVVTTGAWHHLAVCRASGTTRMFFNGTQVGSNYADTLNYVAGYVLLGIGSSFLFPTQGTRGYIDNIRISNNARYTTTFTPTTTEFTSDSNTLLLIKASTNSNNVDTNHRQCFDDAEIKDFPTRSAIKRLTNYNASLSSAQYVTGNESLYLKGNAFLTTTDSSLALGTGDFTIESWAYFNELVNDGLFGLGASNNPGGTGLQLAVHGSGTLYYGDAGGAVNVSLASSFPTSQWVHIAIERYNGTITVYKNGTSIKTVDASTKNYTWTALAIGFYWSSSYCMNGYLNSFRISNSARFQGNFTPTTQRLIPDANTLLLVHGAKSISDAAY